MRRRADLEQLFAKDVPRIRFELAFREERLPFLQRVRAGIHCDIGGEAGVDRAALRGNFP